MPAFRVGTGGRPRRGGQRKEENSVSSSVKGQARCFAFTFTSEIAAARPMADTISLPRRQTRRHPMSGNFSSRPTRLHSSLAAGVPSPERKPRPPPAAAIRARQLGWRHVSAGSSPGSPRGSPSRCFRLRFVPTHGCWKSSRRSRSPRSRKSCRSRAVTWRRSL